MAAERGTVERTVAFLFELAAAEGDVTVSAMAARMGLPQSTAHRLLQQFVALGLVRKTRGARTYQPGPGMHRLGELITRKDTLVQCALPSMQRIVRRFREGCTLAAFRPADNTIEFVSYIPSPHPLRYHVELYQPVSVLWGSSGRAVLAFLPVETVTDVLKANRRSPTGVPAMRPHELQRELGLIRERGFAVSRAGEKIDGATAVSAPVFGPGPRVVGCLTITVPVMRFQEGKEQPMGKALVAEARAIANLLGAGA